MMSTPAVDDNKHVNTKESMTIPAKISPPNMGGCVRRQRLFRMLDQYRDKPAIWISGPAGSGKTMLAASYLHERSLSSVWYQIDARDTDPATLFYYLGMAAKHHSQRGLKSLPLLTPEYLGGISAFVRNFFETLFQRLKPPFVLVFDNYQDIGEDTVFHQIMRDMLSEVPQGGQVLMISRSQPPTEMSRLQAHQYMVLLTWQDLQLNPGEVKGIARMFLKTPLNDIEAEAIHARTLGWAAGVVLLLAQPRQESKSIEVDILRATQSVFDYFSGEILAGLDDKVRTFLIKSAFLPQITTAMATELTGNKQASRILADLARKNYFTMRRSDNRSQLFQFHPLFKEFLQDRAQTLLEPEDLQRLKLKAANILIENHQYEESAVLLESLKDWQRLTQLILEQAQAMVMQGRSGTLQQWINRIPEDFRINVPWLLYWQGVCHLTIDLMTCRSSLEHAFELFKDQDDPAGFYLAWSGIVETYVYEWGDITPLDKWIDEIDALLRSHPQFPSEQIEAQVTSAIFCALMYRCPDHPDVGHWEERVKEIILNTRDMNLKFGLGSHLVLYYSWWIGGQAKAKFIADTLKHALSKASVAPLYQIIWRSLTGINLWMTNHFQVSHDELTEGLAIAEQNGIRFWDFMLLSSLTHCSLCLGKIDDAKSYLNKMSYILGTKRKLDITHYYYMKAFLDLNLGNHALALEHINKALDYGKEAGSPFGYYWAATGKADILIELGEYDQAEHTIDQAFEYGLKMNSHNIEYQCSWLRALLNFKQKNEDAGFVHLRKYLSISREHETVNHTGWRSSVMAPLLQKALNADIQINHVQRLIREHAIQAPALGVHVKNWPYSIKIYTLGSFSVLVDDKPLSHKHRAQNKPLMLLKALIAFGGREVAEEQLSRALWPDADSEAAHVTFTTTLYRLRKLIKHEHAVILKDHRVSLDPQHCWVDTWCLKHFLSQSDLIDSTRKEDAINPSQLTEQIFNLYQGLFLEGENSHWIIGLREQLRNKVLGQIKKIAFLCEEQKHWKQAMVIYEHGLRIDDLLEEFYQGLMRCCKAMNRRAEGLAVYRRCREILSSILGIEPSPQTQDLRRQLRE